LQYRRDIDGLRAVAVIPVVLFHAGVGPFVGGFVGVDIFFVISGFLITSLILDEMSSGRFTIASFYERRVRRIFPALFTLILFCCVAGYFVLSPPEYADLGASAQAATAFSSNILFWNQADYFAPPAELKPLLHTWSLAVEEQFYILFPIFLTILVRYFRGWTAAAIIFFAAASLGLSIWGIWNAPTATFYLAPTRAWELLLGSLLALGFISGPTSTRVRNGLSLAGLALILWGVFMFSKQTAFPGLAALVPCVGTALLIAFGGHQGTVTNRLLSARPVVAVGLISYSLYLWHWPLLVFAKYYANRELEPTEVLALIVAAAVVSTISWRFIEVPVRNRHGYFSRKSLFVWSAVVAFALIGIGILIYASDGIPSRLDAEAARLSAASSDVWEERSHCFSGIGRPPTPTDVAAGRVCRIGSKDAATPSFILWGDSHAAAIAPAIDQAAAQANQVGLFAGYAGCPPVLGIKRFDKSESHECRQFNNAVLRLIADSGIKTVILHARWARYFEDDAFGTELPARLSTSSGEGKNFQAITGGLDRTVESLAGLGAHTIVIASIPEVGYNVPSSLARAAFLQRPPLALPRKADFDLRQHRTNVAFAELERDYHVTVIHPSRYLCNDSTCAILKQGRPLYQDEDHLSRFGALQLDFLFEGIFGNLDKAHESALPVEK